MIALIDNSRSVSLTALFTIFSLYFWAINTYFEIRIPTFCVEIELKSSY